MKESISVRDIFKSLGVPAETYVKRENGKFENDITDAINTKGKLTLLTGPSKTGKTTLYRRTLSDLGFEELSVRCDSELSPEEFWRRALEQVNFEQITRHQKSKIAKISSGAKVSGKIGWSWLAEILGEVNFGIEKSMTESEIRDRIIAKPSPSHLVPILKNLPIILIVEDFHYLCKNTKQAIFQQWKVFVDSEVSVIVVGTTHHAADLAYANMDLAGRIAQIDLSTWNADDLEKIASQGFSKLSVNQQGRVSKEMAKEAAGLPIIVQEACAQMLIDKGHSKINPKESIISVSVDDARKALHRVATLHYKQFETLYERIVTGPRKAARKYNTYELILLIFAKDPLVFSLKRHEIDERLKSIPLSDNERPPTASINSTLNALAKFQERNGMELLEWIPEERKLYILEPSFLFYLRWRELRKGMSPLKDLLDSILEIIRGSSS